MSTATNGSLPANTDVEQDAGKWKSSDAQFHGDISREAQVIDPAVEKRVVRKWVAHIHILDNLRGYS
jgi:hypothetical protein